jgi:hypothetical protein
VEAAPSAPIEPVAGCGVTRDTTQDVADWVARSCAAQGVSVKVTDALVVDQIAALLGHRDARPPARERGRARTWRSSEPPVNFDTVGVQPASAGGAGMDGDVVDHCTDDGDPLTEIESGPGLAQGITTTEISNSLGMRRT